MHALIIGGNRGIGLELARWLAGRGDAVTATARHPESSPQLAALCAQHGARVRVAACDVSSERSVEALAQTMDAAPDLLLHCAGVRTRPDELDSFTIDAARQVFDVNALGFLRVARALLPALLRAGSGTVVALTSDLASLAGNSTGGAYGYRMSKAALNMAVRSLAADVQGQGVVVAAVSPGWVRTDMGGDAAPLSVEDCAEALLMLTDRLGEREHGRFLDRWGAPLPW